MSILLIQLPVPQMNFGRRTGNIPLAAACLQQAWAAQHNAETEILPQASATYLGDGALIEEICSRSPTIVGFSTYAWNVDRVLYLASRLKEHLEISVLLGGPEVTPDNPRIQHSSADLLVYGEGEALLSTLALDPSMAEKGPVTMPIYKAFGKSPSPYIHGHLDAATESLVLLETQRGCPHQCGYCFYGKGRRGVRLATEANVLTAAQWAHDNEVAELYLLDPSLDARPGLHSFLSKMAVINADHTLALHSEIRAESVDEKLADQMAAAGFRGLEIGLQSTNPEALKRTGRTCHLERLVTGTQLLTSRGIACSVDLIIGLPGDTLADFQRSVDLVADHGLDDHLQVFPLSILPGTRFRKEHQHLGLHYDPAPPYLLTHSDTFSADDIEAALDYAERRCGLALYPKPDLDIAWRHSEKDDLYVRIGGRSYIRMLVLSSATTSDDLIRKANQLTHPYQLLVDERVQDQKTVETALAILTQHNPHTPLEIVMLSPAFDVQVDRLLASARMARPNYLDKDLRYAFRQPGNRSLMITLVSSRQRRMITGPMCRQAFWWQSTNLPGKEALKQLAMSDLDGLLMDGRRDTQGVIRWQDRYAPLADELPAISFAGVTHQSRWRALTSEDQYGVNL